MTRMVPSAKRSLSAPSGSSPSNNPSHVPSPVRATIAVPGGCARARQRARTGAQAAAAGDEALDRLIHLYALNRGILLTPFHNMALMSPATTEADVDRHTEVFDAAARELTV